MSPRLPLAWLSSPLLVSCPCLDTVPWRPPRTIRTIIYLPTYSFLLYLTPGFASEHRTSALPKPLPGRLPSQLSVSTRMLTPSAAPSTPLHAGNCTSTELPCTPGYEPHSSPRPHPCSQKLLVLSLLNDSSVPCPLAAPACAVTASVWWTRALSSLWPGPGLPL